MNLGWPVAWEGVEVLHLDDEFHVVYAHGDKFRSAGKYDLIKVLKTKQAATKLRDKKLADLKARQAKWVEEMFFCHPWLVRL